MNTIKLGHGTQSIGLIESDGKLKMCFWENDSPSDVGSLTTDMQKEDEYKIENHHTEIIFDSLDSFIVLEEMMYKAVKFFEKKSENKMKELQFRSNRLIQWINDNYNPHARIIIGCDSAEVLSGETKITNTSFIKD